MKSTEITPSYENLLKTFNGDSIGRDEDVLRFASILNSISSSYTIALDSSWGSGKTFFVKQVKMFLDANNTFVHSISDDDRQSIINKWSATFRSAMPDFQPQVCVYYDAWSNDGDEDPILSVIYEIINSIDSDYSFSKGTDCVQKAAAVLDLFTGRDWTGVIDSFRGDDPLAEIRKAKKLELEIKEFLDSLLSERGNRLVVFVDELDRCRPSFAVKLLERIKHYFSNDRITFVFSINASELQHTIKQHYGEDFDASRYLERFFDLRVSLPPANMARFYKSIGFYGNNLIFDAVCSAVIKKYNFSLREISKYLQLAKVASDGVTRGSIGFYDNDYLFCSIIVVPIMLGLRMRDLNRYTRFIQGEDYSPLTEMVEYIASDYERFLLANNETTDVTAEEEIVVSLEERLKEAYDAIFLYGYTGRNYEKVVGCCSFTKQTKDDLLRRVSLLFNTATYE